MRKLLCALLVLIFVAACICSCTEKDPDTGKTETKVTEQNTSVITTVEPEETKELTKAEIAAPYLEKLGETKYKREFTVLCMQGVGNSEKEIWVENASDEPIDNAVYLRNTAILDRFGVTIVKHAVVDVNSEAQKDNKANTHAYDLIMANGPGTGILAQSGYLLNFLELSETLNLDKEWWDPGTLRDCEINGKVYFMNGDINILDNDVTWILLFNKKLITDFDLEEPYKLVNEGKWTLDKFYEMVSCTDVSRPNPVSGEYDDGAYYGFITTNGGGLTNFLYTCDMTTVRVTDGTPEIICGQKSNAEKITNILEWCKKTVSDSHITYFSRDPGVTKNMFMENHALFYSEVLSYIVNLSDMEYDYGVLPTPKYDEKQKDYRTHVDGVGSMISIPANTPEDKKEEIATIIEALALYSYMYVTPAYYEVTLKRKKSRDPDSSEMIDIILQSRTYDVGYIYQSSIGLADVFRQLVEQGSSGWDGAFQKAEKRATSGIKKIIKQYNKL